MTQPTEYQLIEMYRAWWQSSYGTTPNTQACIVAAAFAAHVLKELEQSDVNS